MGVIKPTWQVVGLKREHREPLHKCFVLQEYWWCASFSMESHCITFYQETQETHVQIISPHNTRLILLCEDEKLINTLHGIYDSDLLHFLGIHNLAFSVCACVSVSVCVRRRYCKRNISEGSSVCVCPHRYPCKTSHACVCTHLCL